MGGENIDLTDDNLILSIKSPRKSVGGPYSVVYKNIIEKWAIVTMTWESKPTLGIRWFWGSKGHPISTGKPVWFVLPGELIEILLETLPIDRKPIDEFLNKNQREKE